MPAATATRYSSNLPPADMGVPVVGNGGVASAYWGKLGRILLLTIVASLIDSQNGDTTVDR